MIFCGQFGVTHRLPVTQVQGMNKIVLRKGEYDELYVENYLKYITTQNPTKVIPKEWTQYTVLHANFNGNLHCGNFEYSTGEVKSILIKRRLKNDITDTWLPLFQVDINNNDDNFKFTIYDKYVRANKEYEYILVPILQQGTEGIMIKAVYPDQENDKVTFNGVHILNYEKSFSTILDVELSTEKNKPSSVINPIGTKYPFVITTSQNNYYTGNISATFLDSEIINGCRQYKSNNNWEYRQELHYRTRKSQTIRA